MKRRGFIRNALTVAVAAALPISLVAAERPIIQEVPAGAWSPSVSYEPGDIVYSDGYFFVSKTGSYEVSLCLNPDAWSEI